MLQLLKNFFKGWKPWSYRFFHLYSYLNQIFFHWAKLSTRVLQFVLPQILVRLYCRKVLSYRSLHNWPETLEGNPFQNKLWLATLSSIVLNKALVAPLNLMRYTMKQTHIINNFQVSFWRKQLDLKIGLKSENGCCRKLREASFPKEKVGDEHVTMFNSCRSYTNALFSIDNQNRIIEFENL